MQFASRRATDRTSRCKPPGSAPVFDQVELQIQQHAASRSYRKAKRKDGRRAPGE